ncbi:hypothetical protein [Kitasatospora sp. NPDC088783]|uniref:hypothetical protein n=1 Tax=Kitasatospora sp. NPDC088783 TaxID=3364077 RepID=UPI00381BE3A6
MHTPQLVRAALTATSPVFTTTLTVTAVATDAVGSAADLPYGIVAGLLPAAALWAALPPLLAGGRPVLRTPAVWAAVTAALVGCLTLAAFFYASFLAFVLVPLLGGCTALAAGGCLAEHRGHRWGTALATVPPLFLALVILPAFATSSLSTVSATAAAFLLTSAALTWTAERRRDGGREKSLPGS